MVISSSSLCATLDEATEPPVKFNKTTVLTFAGRCKSIWQCKLNTVITDANGSKGDIYTFIWVPEKELHNVNTVGDERGSISVANPFPGQLAMLLRSIQKLPARVALTGDVERCEDEQSAAETLEEIIRSEQKAVSGSSYAVSGVLSSSDLFHTSRNGNLEEPLKGDTKYTIYKFNPSAQKVDLEGMRTFEPGELAPFSAQIIDGINQSEARRRALNTFLSHILNTHIKCFEGRLYAIGLIATPAFDEDGYVDYEWKEYRWLSLAEEAHDVNLWKWKKRL